MLDELLSGKDKEAIVEAVHEILMQVAQDFADGKYPVEKFQIAKVCYTSGTLVNM